MGKPMACRLGRHNWVVEQRQLDLDEPPRAIHICTRCQTTRLGGSRFESSDLPENPNGTGTASGFGPQGGGF